VTSRTTDEHSAAGEANSLGPEWYRRIQSHTVQDAAALIHRALRVRPSTVEKDTIGASHAVYFARLPDGTECVLRVAMQPDQDERLELWMIERCRQLGVPVPEVLACEPVPRDAVPAFMIMRRLPGRPGHLVRLPARDRRRVLHQLGEYLRAIHSVPIAGFGPLVPHGRGYGGEEPSLSAYVIRAFAHALERLPEDVVPPARRAALRDRFADAAPLLERPTASLLHGDYRLKNALLEERADGWHVSGIVDFEMASGGDPARDLAYCFYSLRWNPGRRGRWDERDIASICAGYGCPYPLEAALRQRVLLYQTWEAVGNLFWDVSFGDHDGIASILRWLTEFEADIM
jgi:aminoglycoside phosphotransferase (APT) family kinase protein